MKIASPSQLNTEEKGTRSGKGIMTMAFGGNMNKMMKQVQQMQEKMKELKDELAERTVEATAGGGMVKATATGGQEIVSISIDPAVIDPDDIDMLEDLVVAAVNEALRQAEDMVKEEMSKITGGLNIPGLF